MPGELLFSGPFPTRLEHALGVYRLARLARPRDRVLQAAALAHDLGHGPFSHLTEGMLIEQHGEDHEQRSARWLREIGATLELDAARHLSWLDWDEAARLIVGDPRERRAELVNGRLDYDNIDNVARFLTAAALGTPHYDPVALACGLRLLRGHAGRLRAAPAVSATPPSDTGPIAKPGVGGHTFLLTRAASHARGWQSDRSAVYAFLRAGHANLALHAMLRKAIDMGAQADALPSHFLDLTDAEALRVLRRLSHPGIARLLFALRLGGHYRCEWELELDGATPALPRWPVGWRERLELEELLADDAALAPHEVVVEMIAASAPRMLPPISVTDASRTLFVLPTPLPAPARVHVFVPLDIGRDYVRRVCIAAERYIGARGKVVHSAVG